MFKLRVIRHRIFEIRGFPFYQPRHRKHNGTISDHYFPVYGNQGRVTSEQVDHKGRTTWRGTTEEWQNAMQTRWITTRKGIREAIPPQYTKFIANQFFTNSPLLT
jgi:hypothetical protein